MAARLEWGADSERQIQTVEDLDRLLDELENDAKEDPFLVELIRAGGESLSFGLGGPQTVLDYVPADLDPPYLQSHGVPVSDDALAFRLRGELSEFPPDAGVPTEMGREVLRHFLRKGELSPTISWRET